MNPLPPTTGDPTIDGLVSWLTNGGSLASPGAVLGLGILVKVILIPLLARICIRFNITFSGPNKLHAVTLVGVAVAFLINLVSHAHLHFGDVAILGVQIGATAVGIHEGMATLTDASKAQVSVNLIKETLSPIVSVRNGAGDLAQLGVKP